MGKSESNTCRTATNAIQIGSCRAPPGWEKKRLSVLEASGVRIASCGVVFPLLAAIHSSREHP